MSQKPKQDEPLTHPARFYSLSCSARFSSASSLRTNPAVVAAVGGLVVANAGGSALNGLKSARPQSPHFLCGPGPGVSLAPAGPFPFLILDSIRLLHL